MKAIFTARLSGPPKWSTLNIFNYLSGNYDDITLIFEDVIPKMELIDTSFLYEHQKKIWESFNVNVLLSSEVINQIEVEEIFQTMSIKDLYSVVPEKIKMGTMGIRIKDAIHFIRLCAVINHFNEYKWVSGKGLKKVFNLLNQKSKHAIDFELIEDFPKSYFRESKYVNNPSFFNKEENSELIVLSRHLWDKYEHAFKTITL
jgi:hypothetical protein